MSTTVAPPPVSYSQVLAAGLVRRGPPSRLSATSALQRLKAGYAASESSDSGISLADTSSEYGFSDDVINTTDGSEAGHDDAIEVDKDFLPPNFDRMRVQVFTGHCADANCFLEGLVFGATFSDANIYEDLFKIPKRDLFNERDPRIRFVDRRGDAFTVVNVMRQWNKLAGNEEIGRKEKKEWCAKHSLNMGVIEGLESTTENHRELTLRQKPDVGSLKFSEVTEAISDSLVESVAYVYRDNICVYQGHDELGYRNVFNNETVHLHKLSSLHLMARPAPVIIAFGNKQAAFAIAVEPRLCSFDEKHVNDVYESCKVTPFPVDYIGHITAQKILEFWNPATTISSGSLKQMAQEITNGSPVVVERALSFRNRLLFYALPKYHKQLKRFLSDAISFIRKDLLTHKMSVPFPYNYNNFHINIEAGGIVNEVCFEDDKSDVPRGNITYQNDGDLLEFQSNVTVTVTSKVTFLRLKSRRNPTALTLQAIVIRLLDDVAPDSWNIDEALAVATNNPLVQDLVCKVTFKDHYSAWRGMSILEGARCLGMTLKLVDKCRTESFLNQFTVSLDARVYKIHESLLTTFLRHHQQSPVYDIEYKILKEEHTHSIQIITKCRQHTMELMQRLKEQLQPVIFLPPNRRKNYSDLLEPAYAIWLENVMSETDTIISVRVLEREIWIYGSKANKDIAKRSINKCLGHELYYSSTWNVCDLSDDGYDNDAILKALAPHDFDFQKMVGSLTIPVQAAQLNLYNSTLLVYSEHGDTQMKEPFQKLLGWKETSGQPGITPPESQVCCVCYAEPKEKDIYVTESCGHVYCTDCLREQLDCTIRNTLFPLACAADNIPFSLADIYNSCVRLPLGKRTKILKSCLRNFVNNHAREYRFCPKPSCLGIMTVGKDTPLRKRGICFYCNVHNCALCGERRHPGISCEEYKENFLGLQKWLSENHKTRKLCSNCNMGIEKVDGCNNVHCVFCKKSLCWRCMKSFDKSGDCYAHMDQAKHWDDEED